MKLFITWTSDYRNVEKETIREINTLKHFYEFLIEMDEELIISKREDPNELDVEIYNDYRE